MDLRESGERVGLTRAVLGRLESNVHFSLDSQLAEIIRPEVASRVLGDTRLSEIAPPGAVLQGRCFVLTSRGAVEVSQAKVMRRKVL